MQRFLKTVLLSSDVISFSSLIKSMERWNCILC